MSRRDTIIISVLVNAALLAVLFITAVTSKNSAKEDAKIASSTILEETTIDAKDLFSANTENKDGVIVENKDAQAVVNVENKDASLIKENIPQEVQKEFLSVIDENDKNIKPQEEKVLYKLPEALANVEEKKEEITPEVTNKIVTVKKGDTLEKIARVNKVKVSELTKANKLQNSFLKIGQQLVIPKKAEKNIASNTESKAEYIGKDQPEYYTLKVGDNPYTVAVKHNLKLSDFLKINNLDEKKARKLKPGDKLRIR